MSHPTVVLLVQADEGAHAQAMVALGRPAGARIASPSRSGRLSRFIRILATKPALRGCYEAPNNPAHAA